jgi:formylglycine-generating enzyme required for sulfatase activity
MKSMPDHEGRGPSRGDVDADHPEFAPPWATVFGEDDHGIFARCEVKGVPFAWRWIPRGRFRMGSPANEPERFDDEGPQHDVNITRGFWLGETPVTQCQWEAVMGSNPSGFKAGAKALDGRWHPVESVSWDECMQMARALSDLVPGLQATLPTEAQWEYACRAGTNTALYTGAITIKGENHAPELDAIAWYGGNSGQALEVNDGYDASDWPKRQYPDKLGGTHRVGLKAPNGWGLRDMIGNVWEWCLDGQRAYTEEAQWDPGTQDDAPEAKVASRVVRGGSWFIRAGGCRSASRGDGRRGDRRDGLGLRLLAGPGSQSS